MRIQAYTDALTWAGTIADHVADASHHETTAVKRTIATGVLAIVLLPGRAAAQPSESPGYCDGVDVPSAVAAVIDLLNSIQTWGVGIGLAAAAVAYVYAGILLTFGGGDPQRVERAKTVVLYATAGIVVILLSGGLVELVETKICAGLG